AGSPRPVRLVALFFFFEAEDGIRDLYVTGVQTCALPISRFRVRMVSRVTLLSRKRGLMAAQYRADHVGSLLRPQEILEARAKKRSEERRVGRDSTTGRAAEQQHKCGRRSVGSEALPERSA